MEVEVRVRLRAALMISSIVMRSFPCPVSSTDTVNIPRSAYISPPPRAKAHIEYASSRLQY